MKKNARISAYVAGLETDPNGSLDPRYQGYFLCFNRGEYYEAHDVLENLWLETRDANYGFYKGLIQIAGAFVHLRKQALRPDHPKDGRRLAPASRLFELSRLNLEPYRPRHLQLDVTGLLEMAARYRQAILTGNFSQNPWHPASIPELKIESPGSLDGPNPAA